jgi:hypothetical protein
VSKGHPYIWCSGSQSGVSFQPRGAPERRAGHREARGSAGSFALRSRGAHHLDPRLRDRMLGIHSGGPQRPRSLSADRPRSCAYDPDSTVVRPRSHGCYVFHLVEVPVLAKFSATFCGLFPGLWCGRCRNELPSAACASSPMNGAVDLNEFVDEGSR